MSDSSTTSVLRRVRAEIDVILLLLFFAAMIVVAQDFNPVARQFPVLFLWFGLVAMAVELLVVVLPAKYSQRIQRLTTGLAADMDSGLDTESGSVDEEPTESDGMGEMKTVALTLGLIIGFGVLALYISFLLAIPIFVFGSIYLLGSKNPVKAAITSAVLMVGVYGLFGEVMNVPVDHGELIGFNQLVDLVMTIGGL